MEAVRQEYEGILADFREQAKTKFAELNADKEALQASIDSLQASVEVLQYYCLQTFSKSKI